MRYRDRLSISSERQRQLSRAMELALIGLFFVGLERRAVGVVVTTAIAFGVTHLPAVLERDYNIPMDAGLTLWITAAAFLHAVGVVGIPGTDTSIYAGIPWWDHLTHALSASVVAAAGYASARAIDLHSEEVVLPPRFMFVFILAMTMAFGVFWEVLEFAISEVAGLLGAEAVGFTQHGLDDTMLDLVFDTAGAVVVATWGTAHLTDVVGALAEKLEADRVDR